MKEENQLLIEKKLRSELTPDEEDVFQDRMKSDEGFKESYLFEKQLIENLDDEDWNLAENPNQNEVGQYAELFRDNQTKDLKQTLEKVKAEFRNKEETHLRKIGWIWYAAAAAIVIMIISIFALTDWTQTPNELYLSYFDKKEMPSLIHRGNDVDDQLVEAQQLFESGDYEKALSIFDHLIDTRLTNRATIYIYKGISEMELNQYVKASQTFNKLINSNLMDASKGYWFKGLLYLKMNEKDKAIKVFEKIQADSLYNHQKSAEILNSLQ